MADDPYLQANVQVTRDVLLSVGLAAMGLLTVACESGSDSSGELLASEFHVNECARRPTSRVSGQSTAGFEGRQCVAWKMTEGGLLVDLLGFPETCGFQGLSESTLWRGTAREADSVLTLDVEWKSKAVSACGSCAHDFSFVVSGTEARAAAILQVRTRSCSECPWTDVDLRIEKGLNGAGIQCR